MRALALIGFLGACSLATDFDRDLAVEQSATLCADTVDNDADGLTDCQDWKCAAQPVCCTIPVVVLADDFADAACAAAACAPGGVCPPVAERWQAWGAPDPQVCDGAFVPGKSEQCYDVGLLGVEPFPLRPGLVVAGGFSGRPELRGRIALGVTFQQQVNGSLDACAPIEPADPALSIVLLAAEGGHRFVARFGDRDAGATAVFTDEVRREAAIRVTADRRVEYAIDGAVFATSAPAETVPTDERTVRVVVAGRGWSARIEDVEVTVGARCESPAAWAMADPFLALDVRPAPGVWDSFSVYGPSIVPAAADRPAQIYFGGCAERVGTCEAVTAGYGRATADLDGAFVRDTTCPLVSNSGLTCPGGIASPFGEQYYNVFDLDVAAAGPGVVGVLSKATGGLEVALVDDTSGALALAAAPRLGLGPPGSWDAAEVCCATAVADASGTLRVWYSGRATPGGPRRIGLADWGPDGPVKYAQNPVLVEGPAGASDDRGVSHPDVVWDARRGLYRMWYLADGPLGLTSIGYAVSTDGVAWHRAPDNPVIDPDALGLRRVGGPAVTSVDGNLELWVEGVAPERAGSQIYRLTNTGVDPAPP